MVGAINAARRHSTGATEWKHLVQLLSVKNLAHLLAISAVSVRRYARSTRATPDGVVARLHWLALVVDDLAGAYNGIGIRQWFDRKRAQLGGRTPAQVLTRDWEPDDRCAERVRSLARSLAGPPAT